MATAVPALHRANRVLALLAARAPQRLTVSQVAAELAMSKATCFAQLGALTDLGWVVRAEPDKTYGLGPELVRLGWASIEHAGVAAPGVHVARREMFGLATALDVGCFLCRLVEDDMVILDRAGAELPEFGLPGIDALRVPARPPLGSVYFAWSGQGEIDAWLRRAGAATAGPERDAQLRALAAIRARGYSTGGGREVQLQLEELIERLATSTSSERVALALSVADLVRGTPEGDGPHHPVPHLIAPAFGPTAEVALTLTIVGRPGQLHSGNVERFAGPLLASMDRVTAALGGRRPEPSPPAG
jgi:DNA-binding IclR family transcriptional regulator